MAVLTIEVKEIDGHSMIATFKTKNDNGREIEHLTAKMIGQMLAKTILPELLPEIVKTAHLIIDGHQEPEHEHTTH